MRATEEMPSCSVYKVDGSRRYGEAGKRTKLWHYEVTYCPKGCTYRYKLFALKDESSDPVCKHTVPDLPEERVSDWVIKEDCKRPPFSTLFTSSGPFRRSEDLDSRTVNAVSAIDREDTRQIDTLNTIKQVLEESDVSLTECCNASQVVIPPGFLSGDVPLPSSQSVDTSQPLVSQRLYARGGGPHHNVGDGIHDVNVSFLQHRGATYAAVLSSQKISARCVNTYPVTSVLRPLCTTEYNPHVTHYLPCVQPLRLLQIPSTTEVSRRDSAACLPNHGHPLAIGGSTSNIWAPQTPDSATTARKMPVERDQSYVQMTHQVCSSDVSVTGDLYMGMHERQLPLYARYARYIAPRLSINRQRYYLSRWVHADVHSGDRDAGNARRELALLPRTSSAEFTTWNDPRAVENVPNNETVMIRSEELYFGTYKKF